MRRSLRSWAELLLPWTALAAVGIAAERSAYGFADARDWIPDLVTGWTLAACGLVAWQRLNERRCGVLMAATGLAWFAPNFGWLTAQLIYLHRGPLVQLSLTYPRGRVRRILEAMAVAGTYAISVVFAVWASPVATIVVAVALVLVAAIGFLRSVGLERRERLRGLQATVFLGGVLVLTAVMHLTIPRAGADTAALHVYESSLCALAVALLVGLVQAPWKRPALTDLVVELGESRSGALRGELARTLGDPTLQVGYWLPELAGFVDGDGRPLLLPQPSAAQSTTRIERDGEPLAILVHDPAILTDPALVNAVSAAAGLAAVNARLQAELRARVDEVAASRRRILAAGDEQRRRLERRLEFGAERHLEQLGELLHGVRAPAAAQTRARIAHAETRLAQTLDDLRRFARGIHPRELTEHGLAAALESLAAGFPVPVDLRVSIQEASPAVQACAYFVCSEALANVAKYAAQARVRVAVTSTGDVIAVEIEDDGPGGADPDRGSGLRGLNDRVETFGGTLTLDSPPGRGTIVRAELPSRA